MDTKKISGENEETLTKPNIVVANIVVVAVFLLVVGAVYYKVSKKSKGSQVFPAGVNYLSPKDGESKEDQKALYDFAQLAESADWVSYKGKIYPFTFQHPKTLKALTFPNDQSDSVTFKVSEVAPELNLMFLVESISSRDFKYVGQPEDFVTNYWRFFSGLKGVNNVEAFTNDKGLKGFRASYVAKVNNTVTNDNYFFVIEGEDDKILHISNIFGEDGKALFNRIVNSLGYSK